jgi:hypothetical protein
LCVNSKNIPDLNELIILVETLSEGILVVTGWRGKSNYEIVEDPSQDYRLKLKVKAIRIYTGSLST